MLASSPIMKIERAQLQLLKWFRAHKRELPWRANKDPYRIWISETMLQQTTTTAVIPFFERFLNRFPNLETLAEAPEADVMAAWAGLGYYSRARNLHKAAQKIVQNGGFPRSHEALLELPGFGPYTARSVASLAFGEPVGVVDGNVIRVLTRLYDKDMEWWKPSARSRLQSLADSWTAHQPSSEINQGLMELGRTICRSRSPLCPLCPLRLRCLSLKRGTIDLRPRAKPRRAKEIWHWTPRVEIVNGRLKLERNKTLPFLKGEWLLPGEGRVLRAAPDRYDFRHSITHYDIFVTVQYKATKLKSVESRWVPVEEIKKHVPSSLVLKALRPPHASQRRMRKRARGKVKNSGHNPIHG